MNKVYCVAIIKQGKDLQRGFTVSGPDCREALNTAMEFAEYHVKRGLHVRITCQKEIVWDSKASK